MLKSRSFIDLVALKAGSVDISKENDCVNKGLFEQSLQSETVSSIKNAIKNLHLKQAKYIKTCCILNALEKCLSDVSFNDEICKKINNILYRPELEEMSKIRLKNGKISNILGVKFQIVHECNLNSSEKIALKTLLPKKLSDSCLYFSKQLKLLKERDLLQHIENSFASKSIFNYHKMKIVNLQNSVLIKVNVLNNVIEQTGSILDKYITYRHHLLNEYIYKLIDNQEKSALEVELNARILKLKLELLILTLNDKSFEAALILHRKLIEKEEETSAELISVKYELDEYKNLEDSEFMSIVSSYNKLRQKLQYWRSMVVDLLNQNVD